MDPHRLRAALAVAVVVVLTAAIPASATPTAVTFHLVGTHPPDADYHQGTFTAPSPLCPSGTWQGNGQGSRVFTCADGSGTFTANFSGEVEHTAGASGPWSITAGTGTYGALRGTGRATIDSSTGPNGNRSLHRHLARARRLRQHRANDQGAPGDGNATWEGAQLRAPSLVRMSRQRGREQRLLHRAHRHGCVGSGQARGKDDRSRKPLAQGSAAAKRALRQRRHHGDGSGREPADNRTARRAWQTPELTS